jgi:hypothetical protein
MARFRMTRESFIRPSWQVASQGGSGATAYIIYTYDDYKPCLVLFEGSKAKPAKHYAYKSVDERDSAVAKWASVYECRTAERDRAAAAAKTWQTAARLAGQPYRVGDLLHTSWGYDQTNCDFYVVVAAGAKSFQVRAIGRREVEGSAGFMSCAYYADPSVVVGEVIRVVPRPSDGGNWHCKINGHYAFKTDVDKKHYCSWYA